MSDTKNEGFEATADHSDVASNDSQAPRTSHDAPSIDFNTFLMSLSASALMHLGHLDDAPDEERSLPLARQTIDCIAMLEEKTKGNLTGEEERLLSGVLHDLRLRYVQASKAGKA